MPFDIWCEGCKIHVARGVRFNARKKQIGTYFTTKIWNFRMKCHLCDNWFEIETDPKVLMPKSVHIGTEMDRIALMW